MTVETPREKMRRILVNALVGLGLYAVGAVTGGVWSFDWDGSQPSLKLDKISVSQLHHGLRSSNLYRLSLPFDRPVKLDEVKVRYTVNGEDKELLFSGGNTVTNLWHLDGEFAVPQVWRAYWKPVTIDDLKTLGAITPPGYEARVKSLKLTYRSIGGGDPVTLEHQL